MSKLFRWGHLVVGLAMLAAVGVTFAIAPLQGGRGAATVDLKAMIPERFGEWRPDPETAKIVASPQVEAGLARVYQETLSRTYVNQRGERIMLSIAYTGDIDQQMDIHRPEFCYPAQGFDIVVKNFDGIVRAGGVDLPVKKLVARAGLRTEPITYWITVGDTAAAQGWRRKLTRLRYGLTGKIPDGMLVRVSAVSKDVGAAFTEQAQFIEQLLANLPEASRRRLIGTTEG